MNKISSLLKYLYSFGQISEYRYLREVYAQELPEEFLKNNFPYAYSIYQSEGMSKPAPVYINMLNQIKAKFEIGTDSDADEFLRNNNALSFSDIVNLLKLKKEEIKSSEEDFYKDTGIPEDKMLDLRRLGASKEEILFIFDETTRGNHTIENAASDLITILKEKDYLASKGVKDLKPVTSFDNLDDAYNYFIELANNIRSDYKEKFKDSIRNKLLRYYRYIYDGKKDPDHDYSDYKGIELGGAKANSKIIGKVGDYTIIFSSSMEAAQYWERGAVKIKDGNVEFLLCTSRIYQENFKRENLYEQYKEYFMFQFIKDFSGEPKFNNEISNPNDLITVCFKIKEGKVKVSWGGSTTVNSNDVPISKEDFEKSFKSSEEASRALDACRSFILSFVTEKGSFFHYGLQNNPKFKHLIAEKAEKLSAREFFDYGLQNIPECKDLIEKAVEEAKELSPENFFLYKLQDVPECKHLIVEKAEEADPGIFFHYGLQNIPECEHLFAQKAEGIRAISFFNRGFQNIPQCKHLILQKAKELSPTNFFRHFRYNLQGNPELYHLSVQKAEEISGDDFFSWRLQDSPEYKHLIAEKAEKLSAREFFKHGLQNIPEYKHLTAEKAEEADAGTFFGYRLQDSPEYRHLIAEKAKEFSPDAFFSSELDNFPECKHLIKQKAEEISGDDFFLFRLYDLPGCEERLVVEKAQELDAYHFFYYGLQNDSELFNLFPGLYHLFVQKAEEVSGNSFFHYGLQYIPECKHLIAQKAEELDRHTFSRHKLYEFPECKDITERLGYQV